MRYHPLTQSDRAAMLAKIGAPDIDALFRDVPKEAIVSRAKFDLPDTKGELAVERALSRLSAQSTAAGSRRRGDPRCRGQRSRTNYQRRPFAVARPSDRHGICRDAPGGARHNGHARAARQTVPGNRHANAFRPSPLSP
jgi:hypothetical protein